MPYHHLTYSDRIKINALLQVGRSVPSIAEEIERPKSTLYRELHRNSYGSFYFCDHAEAKAKERRVNASEDRDEDEEILSCIDLGLRQGMSPEQISGRMKVETSSAPSTSTIYRRIAEDKDSGGDWWLLLRRGGGRYRRKYGSALKTRETIKNRVSIEKRPEIIENRERLGDLEGDTIVGARHSGVLLTLNDRVSKKVVIRKLTSKNAIHVSEVMSAAVEEFKGPLRSCTLDNGTEFAAHETFTEKTGTPVYFCHTMSPQERGSNENTNGLIRQYIPKGTDIASVSPERLQFIEDSLNNRPRKSLNFMTPNEYESTRKISNYFFC